MDRLKKLEIISGIAERVSAELKELKAWIKLEFSEELNPGDHGPEVNDNDVTFNFYPKDTTEADNELEERSHNPSDENVSSIDNSHEIIVDTMMDIKNEEMNFNEQYQLSTSMSSDCDPFQSFNEKDQLQYQNQDQSISNSSASTNTRTKEKVTPLKSIMDKFTLRKSSLAQAKANKKPSNYCSICQIKFPSNPLYREHEQIHFKVPDNYTFIQSQKGNALLDADGFLYQYNQKTTNTIYWKCAIKKCPARAISSNEGEKLRLTGDHNHEKETQHSIKKRKRKNNTDDEAGPSSSANTIDEQLKLNTSGSSDSDGQQISTDSNSQRKGSKNNENEVLIARNDFIDQVYGDASQ